jgi:hypothetical protein
MRGAREWTSAGVLVSYVERDDRAHPLYITPASGRLWQVSLFNSVLLFFFFPLKGAEPRPILLFGE